MDIEEISPAKPGNHFINPVGSATYNIRESAGKNYKFWFTSQKNLYLGP